MYIIARSALVMHDAEEMYALVNDIAAYPSFLPWCGGAEVLAHNDGEMRARVEIAYQSVRQSFITRNRLEPFERITMTLLDGPFSELSGAWEFKTLRPGACRISLDLRFDFANAVVGRVVGPVFKYIANSMVDSFVRRAGEIYGDGNNDGNGKPQPETISVEVVYALPGRQVVEQLQLGGTGASNAPITIEQAIRASSIPARFPELDLAQTPVGVFGAQRPLDWPLANHDRVEIYRPLTMSPNEARRQRAEIERK